MPLPRPFRRRAPRPPVKPVALPPVLRTPRAAAWWITLAVLLVSGAVGGTLWWLLADLAAQAPPAPALPGQPTTAAGSVRGEILRTALAAGAAVGAGITLALAFRRQHHQELSTAHTTHDATERRVTDLYTKAAEQLGHDKAAVRLAGLYALERLAQDNPLHRQTIVNVICAYLRMPYTPPPPPDPEQERKEALRRARRRVHTAIATNTPAASGADPKSERQVRLTAQTILADHLRDTRTPDQRQSRQPASSRLWEGMRIDLTGATLMDFNFGYCHAAQTRFDEVTFTGIAWFNGATFTNDASFSRATFTNDAWFKGVTFTGLAWFDEATFTKDAWFDRPIFINDVWFSRATFTEVARFDEATFTRNAFFEGTTFGQPPHWPRGWRLEVTGEQAWLVEIDRPAAWSPDGA